MILTGVSYEVEGLDGWTDEITEATVTNKRITLCWEQEGEGTYYAELFSTDGTEYSGNFGLRRPERQCEMKCRRFQSIAGDFMLWVEWRRDDTGFGGTSIIQLAPDWE